MQLTSRDSTIASRRQVEPLRAAQACSSTQTLIDDPRCSSEYHMSAQLSALTFGAQEIQRNVLRADILYRIVAQFDTLKV